MENNGRNIRKETQGASYLQVSLREKITWTFHVNENHEASQYDMINGDDLMQDIGLDLLYSTEIPTIQWEHVTMPMKPRRSLHDNNKLTIDMSSKPLRKAEERPIQILDTDEKTYANIDLQAFVRYNT